MKRILLVGILSLAAACPAVSFEEKDTDQVTEQKTSALGQIILEEYKALREEIILCLGERVTIVSFGFAAVGALIAGGMAVLGRGKERWFVSSIVIGVVVTLTCLYVLDVWTVETRRLARASYYNHYLELKLKNLYKGNILPLEWEQRTRDKDGPYMRILPGDKGKPWIFLAVSALSTLSGLGIFWWGTINFPRLKRNGMRISAVSVCALLLYFCAFRPYKDIQRLDEIWAIADQPSQLETTK